MIYVEKSFIFEESQYKNVYVPVCTNAAFCETKTNRQMLKFFVNKNNKKNVYQYEKSMLANMYGYFKNTIHVYHYYNTETCNWRI